MSAPLFTIYALRERGVIEVRYIGQTAKAPAARLAGEIAQAQTIERRQWGAAPTGLHRWLLDTEVEAVPIATADSKAAACARERETVEAFARLGHRLFNRHLVPTDLRTAA